MDDDKELARLRHQLEQTKALYEGAKLDHDRAVERMRDLGIAHRDGSVRHAARLITHTLRNYKSALEQYNRFLLDRAPRSLERLQYKKKSATQT